MSEKAGKQSDCKCAGAMEHATCMAVPAQGQPTLRRYLLPALAGLLAWGFLYDNLAWFAGWITYAVLPLPRGSHLGAAV
jgi:hypothetical protein